MGSTTVCRGPRVLEHGGDSFQASVAEPVLTWIISWTLDLTPLASKLPARRVFHRGKCAPAQVPVPRRHVLVRQPAGDVEHDDRALPVDVIPVPQAAELFL